jgi:hypothetical protein
MMRCSSQKTQRKGKKMKKNQWLAVVVCLALMAPLSALAQDGFQVSSVTVSSGEDPISSGLTGLVRLTNDKEWLLEVAVQQEQAWILYGPGFKLGKVEGVVAGSVGHFQGAPWAGPFLSLNVPIAKNVTFSTFHWPGVFPWEPNDWKTENDGVENPERLFKGYIGSAQVGVGPFAIVYSWQNFLDGPWNELPGLAYTAKVREDFFVSGSATWNNNAEKWMFYVGVTWSPTS